MTATREMEHIGDTRGAKNHDHDLIHHLSQRLDALWRYDQYIANAEGKPEIQEFWRELKRQDTENIQKLKEMVGREIQQGCF